jgi:hypothetical protein
MIVEALDADASIAAVFGSYDDTPAWPDFLSQYKNLMHHYVHQTANERAATFWGGCGAVRKSVFEAFGGFDLERYPNPSIEDIEFGFRISLSGHRIKLAKHIQVKHLKKWTVRGLWRADVHLRAIPWTQLILESRNLPADLNLTPVARLSALLVGLLVAGVLALPLAALEWLPGVRLPALGAALVGIAVPLLALNWNVYAWFAARRGFVFACGAVLAHWAYYFYSGCVFALVLVQHHLRGAPRRDLPPGPPPAAKGAGTPA